MPATEAEKILNRIRPLLEGKTVLDLGCGMKKVVPWATGVDDSSETRIPEVGTIIAKIDPDSQQLGEHLSFEVVFSSHALEHIKNPIKETLQYWLKFVKPGGRLILYLPSEKKYVYDHSDKKKRNPGHCHFLTPDTFIWYLEQIDGIDIEIFEEDPDVPDRYSFLAVCRKK